jgi:predicted Zn-dependent protease
MIEVATKSYGQMPPDHIKGQFSHKSHILLIDNISVKLGTTSEHRTHVIGDLKHNNTHPSTEYYKSSAYIPVHKFWNKDPLDVIIDINPDTIKMSSKYLPDVKSAIHSWSNLLKTNSGNSTFWNFDVRASLNEAVHSAIIIKLSGDPMGQICNDSKVTTYAITSYPRADGPNAYVNIPTSCMVTEKEHEMSHEEIYSTVLHEFGHALGLGHAHNQDGDLMCSTEVTNQMNSTNMTCKPYSVQGAKPSELDIAALFYIYGTDGFNDPNNMLIDADLQNQNNFKPDMKETLSH